MKTFADLKRKMVVGVAATLVFSRHQPHSALGISRKVVKVQSNGIAFESSTSRVGSWLYWPRAAEVVITERGFSIMQGGIEQLRYEVES